MQDVPRRINSGSLKNNDAHFLPVLDPKRPSTPLTGKGLI